MSKTTTVTRQEASAAFVQLMPHIMRGIALDFFLKRGVTQTQFLVLMAVHAFGRISMGALSKSMHVSMPTASGIIDRLAKAGMVRRFAHPEDRRQVLVELTAKGKDFVIDFREIVRRRWEEALGALEPDELEAFFCVVQKLRKRLEAQ